MEREKANHAVSRMCQLLEVSRSGYYAWQKRSPSKRASTDEELLSHIITIYRESRGLYGAPRVQAALKRKYGLRCSKRRVARLMQQAGMVGIRRGKKRKLTRRDPDRTGCPDLVQRQFTAVSPDRLWVADITQHATLEGWLYLAVVIDVFSRKVVGWAMGARLYAELVVSALDMALKNRRPGKGLIHHSDHGSQYTSFAFGERLEQAGLLGSMGTVGDALDNAVAESFFSTLQAELLDQRKWATRAQLRLAIFDYIEVFFNRQRLHSTLGYLSPVEFEMGWRPPVEGDKLLTVH